MQRLAIFNIKNRRFRLIIKISDFVPFSKSAVLCHSKIGSFSRIRIREFPKDLIIEIIENGPFSQKRHDRIDIVKGEKEP